MTAAALRALLLRCDAVAPACARPALAVALRSLDGDASIPALRDAAADLRAAYERAAPPRAGCVRTAREAHADRFRTPWCDPCDDPAELRPLAACVAAVYAAEAAATGERASRVEHYQRAAEGWL